MKVIYDMLLRASGWLACALAHLLVVELQVAVAAHGAGPQVGPLLPDGCVRVQAERQVIVDQVLA